MNGLGLVGVCPGCQLPVTSCICSTPWSELEFDEPEFVLTDEWEAELCKSPEYQLNAHDPPAFWRKRDRDRWIERVVVAMPEGVVAAFKIQSGMKRAERWDR